MNEAELVRPTLGEAARFWCQLGFISFGGPTGQIALMHAELVERRRWISEERFLHALNFCLLLPGPEATQLATYIGWVLHGTRGGVIAGVLFVLPGALLLYLLSWVYVLFGHVAWINGILYGLKPAVIAIIGAALIRIGSRALQGALMWAIAALAFVAMFWFHVSFPIIIAIAAVVGLFGARNEPDSSPALDVGGSSSATLSMRHALKVAATCLLIWWGPVFALWVWLGGTHAVVQEAGFFSQAALVTFGGAYAVLPYVAQQAVSHYSWLDAGQMLDGLALAETTPGPLIIVLQFVGFIGGWNHPGLLAPWQGATLGAFITTWTTFVPCFLWILLGAPHVERLRHLKSLNVALAGVTAAVVGVIFNLAMLFAGQVIWPVGAVQADPFALIVAAVGFVGLWRWKWTVPVVVVAAGIAGCGYRLLVGEAL